MAEGVSDVKRNAETKHLLSPFRWGKGLLLKSLLSPLAAAILQDVLIKGMSFVVFIFLPLEWNQYYFYIVKSQFSWTSVNRLFQELWTDPICKVYVHLWHSRLRFQTEKPSCIRVVKRGRQKNLIKIAIFLRVCSAHKRKTCPKHHQQR